MNLIHILPLQNVTQISQPMEMYLAHTLIDNPELCKCIAKKDSYKILDNGAYELGTSIDFFKIIEIAERIQADEVILPDAMFNTSETLDKTFRALERILANYSHIPFKLMGVIQGKDLEEYRYCTKLFDPIKEIEVIGVPKKFLRASSVPYSKPECAIMRATYASEIKNKEVHLLGLSWNLMELRACKDHVRSCDTSLIAEATKADLSIFEGWQLEKYSLDVPFKDTEIKKFFANAKDAEVYLNAHNR